MTTSRAGGLRAALQRSRPLRTAGAAACGGAVLVVAACGGSAGDGADGAGDTPSDRQEYVNHLEECTVVPEEQIAEAVGAEAVLSTFSGAVCRWQSVDGGTDVQLNWYESGSMQREKSVAEDLGFDVENIRLVGSLGYLMRSPQPGGGCGATATAGGEGLVGWWVHGGGDACEAAQRLVELSVNKSL